MMAPGSIVIAMDKFKGSLTSLEAGNAVAGGLREVCDRSIEVFGLADGGDGLIAVLQRAGTRDERRVEQRSVIVDGEARRYDVAWLSSTPVIESAQLVGMHRGGRLRLDPMEASSEAVGLAIGDLLLGPAGHRPAEVIIGVGGTNCTDAGLGLIRALGADLKDDAGGPVAAGGGGMASLATIDARPARDLLGGTRLVFATDVSAPMHGSGGAALVFAGQKGASAEQVEALDAGLAHVARVLVRQAPGFDADRPGLGAGGGMPAAACALLDARIESGADLAFRSTGLDAALAAAALVITGEGRFDASSLQGKGPGRVLQLAGNRPVIVVAGEVDPGMRGLAPMVHHWYAIVDSAPSRAEGIERAETYLREIGRRIGIDLIELGSSGTNMSGRDDQT